MTHDHIRSAHRTTNWANLSLSAALFALSVTLAVSGDASAAANAGGVSGTTVKRGDVSFSQDGNTLRVRASNGAIIEYNRFSIEAGQIMQFIQPNAQSRVLNRVTGSELSRIDGSLLSNGIVYLVNPQGFRIGNGAVVNVGGFYAAAGRMSDNDFVRGVNNFTNLSGKVVNDGSIHAQSVALVGQYVANRGTINVDDGVVAMASGDRVLLQHGSGPVMVTVDRSKLGADGSGAGTQAGVSNVGTINAGKGKVVLASGDFYALSMDLSGTIIGKSIAARGGAALPGGKGGEVLVNGTLDASDKSGKGGSIDVLGDKVGLLGKAVVNASGATGGGSVRLGGDYQGKNAEVRNASATFIDRDARVSASATKSGDGGRVIVWSDGYTGFYGSVDVSAAGAGAGGFVETSSKGNLQAFGSVNTGSAKGKGGAWLLDPANLTISTATAANVTGSTPFTPTAANSVLNVTQLQNALAAGNVVIQTTNNAFAGTGLITFASNVTSNRAGALLTVNSVGGVQFNDGTTVTVPNLTLNAATTVDFRGTSRLNIGSNLAITTSGAVTQASGSVLAVGGTTRVATGAAAIRLEGTGNDFIGAVTLTNTGANEIAITDSNALVLGGVNMTTSASGRLSVAAGAGITQTGAINTGTGAVTINAGAGAIMLVNAGNNFRGTTSLTNTGNNSISLQTAGALDIGAASMTSTGVGGMIVRSNGTMTQAGVIATGTGVSSFNAGEGAIILENANNDFRGGLMLANTGANNIAITDSNALSLGGVSMTTTDAGALRITSNGNITQASGTRISTGTGAVTIHSGAGAITLDAALNSFRGGVSLTNTGANQITIAAGGTLNLAGVSMSSDAAGGLTVTANGAITQTGAISTGTGASNINAGAGAITLTAATNDFRGTVTLTNTGANNIAINDVNALALSGVNMTQSAAGTLRITSNGNITQDRFSAVRTGTGAVTINAGAGAIGLDSSSNSVAGAVTLSNTGTNDITLATAGRLVVAGVTMDAAAAGGLRLRSNVVSSVGGITQTGAISTGTGASSLTANGGTITLTRADNDFRGVVDVTTQGSGAFDAAITDANALTLGRTSIAQDLTVRANGALNMGNGTIGRNLVATSINVPAGVSGAVMQSGALTVRGTSSITAGAGAITLNNAGNNFVGAVNLTNTGANNIAIADSNALVLGGVNMTATAAGSLSLISNGAITQTGAINTGTGAVTVNAGNGAITLTNAGNNFRGITSLTNTGDNNIAVQTAGSLALSSVSMTPTGSGGLALTTNGAITQSGPINTGTGVSNFSAGNGAITLTNAGNSFRGAVRFANTGANNVAIVDSADLVLGTSTTAGALNLTATGMSQTGVITAGNTTLNVSASGGDIDLSTQANNLGQVTIGNDGGLAANVRDFSLTNVRAGAGAVVNLSNDGTTNLRDVSVQYQAAYQIPSLTMASLRNVNVLSNGAITQAAGGIRNSGTATFSATNSVITLTDANNDFGGEVWVDNTAARRVAGLWSPPPPPPIPPSVQLTTSGSLALSRAGSANALTLTANGDITQTGPITVAGVTAINAGAGAITLNNGGNDFRGAVNLRNTGANNIAIRDIGALTLSGVTMDNAAGSLTVNTQGSILQTGAILTGTGSVTFDASNAASGAIILDNANNDFRGAVSLNNQGQGQNVSIRDVNALALRGITMSPINWGTTLTIVSNGNLTQTGSISSNSGAVTINAGAGAINLGNGSNDFRGAVNLANTGANNIAIRDRGALALSGVNMTAGATGGLSLTAGAGITQSGAINTGTGAGAINAGAGAMALENAGNNFRGATSLTNTGANNIAVRTAGQLSLSGVSMTPTTAGALTINATSGVTQTGGTVVTGTGAVTINAGAGVINLFRGGNSFGGVVNLRNSGANTIQILTVGALVLGNVTMDNLAGELAVSSGGAITQVAGTAINTGTGLVSINARSGQAGQIVLENSGNHFRGTTSLFNGGNNDIAIRTAGALTLQAVDMDATAGGALRITANGLIGHASPDTFRNVISTGTGAVTINAGVGSIALNGTRNDFRGAVSLTSGGNIAIRDQNALTLGGVRMSSAAAGTLTVQADNGSITQVSGTTIVTGTGAVAINATNGEIALRNYFNNIGGPVSLTNTGANDIAIRTDGALRVGNVTMSSGDNGILLLLAGGALTQVANTSIQTGTGAALLSSTAGSITLTNATNDFRGSTGVYAGGTGASAAITDVNALTLAQSTVAQDLTVRANGALNLNSSTDTSGVGRNLFATSNSVPSGASGAVTQTGALSMRGTASINAGNAAIQLNNQDNEFTGGLTLANSGANNIAVTARSELVLSGVNMTAGATGGLSLIAGFGISQTGAINTGTGDITIQAGTSRTTRIPSHIALDGVANNFRGDVNLAASRGGNIAIRAAGPLSLSGVSLALTGALTINSVGVRQTRLSTVVTGTGAVAINAGAGNITLGNLGNDFGGTVTLNNTGAHDAYITDANALVLGASSVGRDLTIGGNAGGVTQAGALTVGRTTNLIAGTAGTDFNLGTQANNLVGGVVIEGGGYAANLRDLAVRNVRTDAGTIVNLDSAITTNLRDLTVRYDNAGYTAPALTMASLRNVRLTAGRGLIVSGDITAHGTGAITLQGNSLRTSQWGVQVSGNRTVSTENGNMNVTGWGGTTNTAVGYNIGVISAGTIAAGGSGNVTITGTGGGMVDPPNTRSIVGYDSQTGVPIWGPGQAHPYVNQEGNSGVMNAGTITSGTTGTVTVTGSGGVGFSGDHTGVSNAGTITSGGTGAVVVTGTGGTGTGGGNHGVVNAGSSLLGAAPGGIITSGGGNVTVTGTGGTGSSGRNIGVLNSSARITSGGGTVAVTGRGGNGEAGDNYGVFNVLSNITSGGGNVTVIGYGAAGDNQSSGNIGIFNFGSTITSGGAGSVTVTGTGGSGGAGTNIGIYNSASTITSGGIGSVRVTGTGGQGGVIPKDWTRTVQVILQVVGAVALAAATVATGGALAPVEAADMGAIFAAGATDVMTAEDAGLVADANGLFNVPLNSAFDFVAGAGLDGEVIASSAENNFARTSLDDLFGIPLLRVSTPAVTTDSFRAALASATGAATYNASAWTINVAQHVQGRTTNSGQGVGEASTKTKGNGFNTGLYIDSGSTITSGGGSVIIDATGGAGPTGAGVAQLRQAQPGFNSGLVSDGVISSGAGGSVSIRARAGTSGSGNEAAVFGSGSLVLSTASMSMTSEGGGFITPGRVLVDGPAVFNAGIGAVQLTNSLNNFSGPVELQTSGVNNVFIRDVNAIEIGYLSMAANSPATLTVVANGDITQTGSIMSGGGLVTFDARDGRIILTNAGNDFRGAVMLGTNRVTALGTGRVNSIEIRDANSLQLASVAMEPSQGGFLSVTTNGNITQTGAIVTGTGVSSFNAGTGAITLTNAGNNFAGSVGLANTGTGTVTVNYQRANAPLTLSNVNVTGPLNITTSNGAIRQVAGTTIVTGTGAVTINPGANLIALDNAGNDFRGTVTLRNTGANGIAIRDTNALALASVTMDNAAGALNIRSNGALTQTGAILSGTGAVTIDAGAGAIRLHSAPNNFRGAVSLTNTGANTILVQDTGSLVVQGITMDNAAGALVITTNGALTQTGAIRTGTNGVTIESGNGLIDLTNAQNDFRGVVGLQSTVANSIAIRDANALSLGSVNMAPNAFGTLRITSNGALTQAAGSTIVTGTGSVIINAGAGAITLNNTGNNFAGPTSLANTGANNITIRDAAALTLGAVSTSGNLSVQTNGALTQAQNTVILTGAGGSSFNAGAGAIALNNAGNDFSGSVSLTNTGANNVAIRDINALNLAGVSMTGGGLTVNTGGTISQTGAIVTGTAVFTAGGGGSITLANANNNFGGAVALSVMGNGSVAIRDANSLVLSDVRVSPTNPGTFSVTTNGALTQVNGTRIITGAGAVAINAGAGAISLNNASNFFAGPTSLTNTGANNITIRDEGALVLSGVSMTPTAAGGLTVNTGGAITQTGAIVTGTGASAFNAGASAITLDNAGNDFRGAVSLTNTGANSIAIRDQGALALSGVSMTQTAAGGLTVNTGGAITQSGAIVTGTGASVLNAGANAITLDNAFNNFGGPTSLTNTGANNITIRDGGALALSSVSMEAAAAGSLSVNALGDITQTGAITTGTGDVTFNANSSAIRLDNAGNDFRGAVSLINSGELDIIIRDSGDVQLDYVFMLAASLRPTPSIVMTLDRDALANQFLSTQGALRVTANGAITQTTDGRIAVGSRGGVAFNAGAGEIRLGNASNDFASVGAVSLTNTGANNITIRDVAALTLGAVRTSGNLSVQTNGALTQAQNTTILTGAGGSSFDAGAGAIALNNVGNDFSGSVSLRNTGANNIAIRDINALNLAGVSMTGGGLTVNTGGAITQSGAIVTGTGASVFNAGANAITLTNASNDFRGSVGLTTTGANDASITDSASLQLGASSVGGNLNVAVGANGVRGTGNLTQNGAVTVQGVTNITAGASNTTINLTNTNNRFVGGVNPAPMSNITSYNVNGTQ